MEDDMSGAPFPSAKKVTAINEAVTLVAEQILIRLRMTESAYLQLGEEEAPTLERAESILG